MQASLPDRVRPHFDPITGAKQKQKTVNIRPSKNKDVIKRSRRGSVCHLLPTIVHWHCWLHCKQYILYTNVSPNSAHRTHLELLTKVMLACAGYCVSSALVLGVTGTSEALDRSGRICSPRPSPPRPIRQPRPALPGAAHNDQIGRDHQTSTKLAPEKTGSPQVHPVLTLSP